MRKLHETLFTRAVLFTHPCDSVTSVQCFTAKAPEDLRSEGTYPRHTALSLSLQVPC